MQNRDNLEDFIKKEVNKIELGGADSMWEAFQGQLNDEADDSKKGFWYWLGLLTIVLLIAAGSFWGGVYFTQNKIAETKEVIPASTESGIIPASQSAI